MPTPIYVPQPKHVAITEKINWEQRYFDATKAAMQGILSNTKFDELSTNGFDKSNVIGNAISYSNEFIAKIRASNYIYNSKYEQRYFDTALSALIGILSNYKFDELCSEGFYKRNIVNTAIAYADELIKCYKQTI